MSAERQFLSRAEVDELLTPGEEVHTFKSIPFRLIGCDMSREKILSLVGVNKHD